jgi:hypothetical protein
MRTYFAVLLSLLWAEYLVSSHYLLSVIYWSEDFLLLIVVFILYIKMSYLRLNLLSA